MLVFSSVFIPLLPTDESAGSLSCCLALRSFICINGCDWNWENTQTESY